MAINLQTLKTRTLSAAIFVVVMIAGLLWNYWSFFILFSVIHFGCWMEYQKLIGLIDKDYAEITPFHKYGVMIAGWCMMLYFTNDAFTVFNLRMNELGWWLGLMFVFILPIIELLFAKYIHLKNIGYSFLGLIYISLSWGLMMDLNNNLLFTQYNNAFILTVPFLPLFIIVCMWINDTMAYIVGSFIGKTILSKISPNKTWEGTIGGILLCVLVAGFLVGKVFQSFEFLIAAYQFYIIAAIAAIAGTFGDLLQSKLKRMAGVKDSGHIMPGHGGFLDRFDSLLVAIPFVWMYVKLFIK
ncbi:MAG: phosphatidate cytidylyltransferase [Bacteroidota bacterium]|nr:phosphatidate cytidylyltransferase [Bacteroidota bacterium]